MKEKKEISVYFANWNLDRLPAEQAGEVAGIPWDCVTNIKHAFWKVTPADGSTETSFERRDRGDTPRTEFTIQSMWQKYDMEDLSDPDHDEGCPIWGTAKEDADHFTALMAEMREAMDATFGKGVKKLTACCAGSTTTILPLQDSELMLESFVLERLFMHLRSR